MNKTAYPPTESIGLEEHSVNGDNPDEVDLLDALITIARQKVLIVKVTAACCAIAAIVSFLVPARYTAVTSIAPPQESKSSVSMMLSQLAAMAPGSLASMVAGAQKSPNDLYIGILKSQTVADSLIMRFDLQKVYREEKLSETRKELGKRSEILTDKDGLIRISFEDRDPKRATAVANAYVEELRTMMQQLAFTEASRRRSFFEQETQEAKEKLSSAEVALKETQRTTGAIQIDSQAKAAIEAIAMVRGKIAAKEVQLQTMRTFATEQNPEVVRITEELAGLRTQLRKLEYQQPADPSSPIPAASKVPSVALEYVRHLREVKYREALFEVLAKQYEAAKLDEAKDAAIIQVIDRATEPDKKSSPKRLLIIGLATCAGFSGSIVYCFFAAAMAPRFQEPGFASRVALLRSLVLSNPRYKFERAGLK